MAASFKQCDVMAAAFTQQWQFLLTPEVPLHSRSDLSRVSFHQIPHRLPEDSNQHTCRLLWRSLRSSRTSRRVWTSPCSTPNGSRAAPSSCVWGASPEEPGCCRSTRSSTEKLSSSGRWVHSSGLLRSPHVSSGLLRSPHVSSCL